MLALLLERRFPALVRYAGAAVLVAVAAFFQVIFQEALGRYPFLLFIPPIFISALMFDSGTAYFATVLGASLAGFFFIPAPVGALAIGGEVPAVALFVLIGFAIGAVTEDLRNAIFRLKYAEETKTLLLKELAHRTKNDLTIVQSVLSLQARRQADPKVAEALNAAIGRIHVLARAHQRLSLTEHQLGVDLAHYVQSICDDHAALIGDVRPISIDVHCDPLLVSNPQAVTVGLIINELVTNALKYAFPEEAEGRVSVEVRFAGPRSLTVEVTDTGIGCPSEPQGFGSRLVRMLAVQHGGAIEHIPTLVGCRVRATLRL